jgi:uncharacterized damage-inducible protein DinB
MYRRLSDFRRTWASESEATLKLLLTLTDASLGQAVGPDGRTLGRLAWHVTCTVREMMERTGLKVAGPEYESDVPSTAAAIADAYQASAASLTSALDAWTDADLETKDAMYGGEHWPRGVTLFALVMHQAHHRGQMTVLMRQAGLRVPGLMGPAREDWASMGMAAPRI